GEIIECGPGRSFRLNTLLRRVESGEHQCVGFRQRRALAPVHSGSRGSGLVDWLVQMTGMDSRKHSWSRTFLSVCAGIMLLAASACAKKDDGRAIVARIRPGHPRLMMLPDTIAAIREELPKDPWLQRRYREQKSRADRVLTQ